MPPPFSVQMWQPSRRGRAATRRRDDGAAVNYAEPTTAVGSAVVAPTPDPGRYRSVL